ncbi:uncharacterized protein A4U43_C04F24490 [Asparagus officinalis]|uniref:Malectin-like domain-containing protein n=1 Tax=Asparagus officinalis TaxID=4686 RepID=A0A5P1F8Q2_ASPOF|nr:uncharacterized protein A4U43_C04F24490 [Asparagus officinalis]
MGKVATDIVGLKEQTWVEVLADKVFGFQDISIDNLELVFDEYYKNEDEAKAFMIRSKGTHLLRLHFYPFSAQRYNLSSAQFHVTASGFVLLKDFSFGTRGDSAALPQLKEYLVNLDSGKFVLAFVPADCSSFAFVNAIEVVSAPEGLVADAARLVNFDKVENFDGISKQALQTLYRINVGGPKVTAFNDTFWRNWVPDSGYLVLNSASKDVIFSGKIMYQKFGASREVAPDNVYNSARTSRSNMTWNFAVDPGYKYLIRMHFCDIASLALNELYFDIYINGYSAYQNFDISDATGQVLASPHYEDFVIDVGSLGNLNVVVGPSKLTDPSKIGGLLNGLEIMKMNNTFGSLDGESSLVFALENQRAGSFAGIVRSMACWFGFMSLSIVVLMLALRWRAERREPLAWSRLPVDVLESELVKRSPLVPGKFVYF